MRALTAIVFLLCLLPGLLQAEEKYVTLDDGSSIKVFLFYPKNADEGPWPLTVLPTARMALRRNSIAA